MIGSDGMAGFDRILLPELEAIAFFRRATDEEVTASFAAYGRGAADLIAVWRAVADPLRATLDGLGAAIYHRARWLPRRFNQMTFLATLRAVLAAGQTFFDEQLRPETARAIRSAFAFLDGRHAHVPPGYAPRFRFPDAFAAFVDGGTLDDAKLRFHLIALLNEVQQHSYSLHLAERLGLPELARHADVERQMALAYFAAWSPPATVELWRQCLLVLDGLNAAVFEMALRTERVTFPAAALWHARTAGAEWRAFVDGLDRRERAA